MPPRRRRLLLALGAGVTALTGCSSRDSAETEPDRTTAEPTTRAASKTTGRRPTRTDDASSSTATPTDRPPSTATDEPTTRPPATTTEPPRTTDRATPADPSPDTGSGLITKPVEILVLARRELPGDGWELDSSSYEPGYMAETYGRTETTETIVQELHKYNSNDAATAEYGTDTLASLGPASAEESRSLQLGMESEWYYGAADGTVAELITIRDANVAAFLYWEATGTDRVKFDAIHALATTMQAKWR